MGVQVLLECEIADESHATDAAVEFDAREYLSLGSFAISVWTRV